MGEWFVGKAVGNRGQRKYLENDKKKTERARSALMLDGEISKYLGKLMFLHGADQRCTSSPKLFTR